MTKFIPTKKTNPCPACGDTKGKCRTFPDSPVVLCMNSAGSLERMGWINTGDTKDGLWGKLIPDDEQTRGKSWQEQQEEIARKIERDRAREREKLKHALPEDERSPEFRKLLRQLELDEEDKQDLIQRGLTLEEIKELRIKSVQPNQKVEDIKPNLPGITFGDTISVAGSGYLCPAYDEFGKIIGCQIRIRDAEDNKYRWLKGRFSSHLLVEGNQELPLTVLRGAGEDVYLGEGILKPGIANQRHNRTFIGASGGNFSNSPNQLKRILNNVAKNGKAYFCPDAGFNFNPKVQRRDRATVELVQSLGYEVYILDWGQLEDKAAGDIDEISPEILGNATAIPATEFFKSPEQKTVETEAGGKEVSKEEWSKQKVEKLFDDFLQHKITLGQKLIAKEKVEAEKEAPKVVEPVLEGTYEPNYIVGELQEDVPDGEKKPTAIYRKEQTSLITSEAITKNKVTLNNGEAGIGKTHYVVNNLNAGTLYGWNEDGSPRGEILLLSQSPDKLPIDTSKNPNITRLPTIQPDNCSRVELRRFTAEKELAGSSQAHGEHDSNPVCSTCADLEKCKRSGFKAKMKNAMSYPFKVAHQQGVPGGATNQKRLLVIDELDAINPTENKEISFDEFERFFATLEHEGETYLLEMLKPIRAFFRPYLAGVKAIPEHGFDLSQLQETIPSFSEVDLQEILFSLSAKEKEWAKRDRAKINADTQPEDLEGRIPWASSLVALLHQEIAGSARLEDKEIKLTLPNQRLKSLIDSADSVLLLSATATAEQVSLLFDIDLSQIQEIKPVPTYTPYSEIKQLTGAKLKTKLRKEKGKARKKAIIWEIEKRHQDVGVIDFPAHATEDELKHFCAGEDGAIGSNRFSQKEALVSIGTPYPNLGATLDEYQALTGRVVPSEDLKTDPEFNAYYNQKVKGYFIQNAGRLRANRRPNEHLTYYAVTDYDLSFLAKELGVKVTQTPVWREFPNCDELQTPRVRYIKHLTQLFADVIQFGEQITDLKQKDVAKAIGIDAGFLSRMVGGWRQFLKKIDACIGDPNTKVNLNNHIENLLLSLIGETLETQAKKVIQEIKRVGWREIVANFFQLSNIVQAQMITVFGFIVKRDRAWLDPIRQFLVEDAGLTYEELGINPPPT